MMQKHIEITKSPEAKGLGKKVVLFLCLVAVIISLLVAVAVDAYFNYKDTIILQQEQFLLELSKNAARSVEIYVEDAQEGLAFISNSLTSENYKELIKQYFFAKQNDLYGIILSDSQGKELYKVPSNLDPHLDKAPISNKPSIGKPFEMDAKHFAFTITHPIYDDGAYTSNLILILKIDRIYETIIQPIKTGVKGYTLVKDSDGIIIMHPMEYQLGLDVIDGRRLAYPHLDFSDLEKLIERQLRGEEGYSLYNSYWWADEVPHQVKKLNGFAPAHFGDDFWVVATALDYKELDFPVANTFRNLFAIVLIIVCVFLATIVMMLKIQKDKQNLALELKHLEELNVALEDLQSSKQQLNHYQKLKTIGIFTSGIAHEINNLLTPVLGYSEIMLHTISKDSETYEDAQGIHEAALKAKEIIEQILIFSRRNPSTDKFRYVSINMIIDKSIKLISNFTPSNIEVFKENSVEGYVWCNETQMTQVLINLFTNACQAMENNGGLLRVSLELTKNNNEDYVNIQVADTGCGIAEQDLEEIFCPFFTTKAVGKGNGLGLSVVQGLVLNHHGEISVDSEVGQGSTFTISLPYHATIEQTPEPSHKKRKSTRKRNVLIVDDDKKICHMLKRGLTAKGYGVDTYSDSVAVADLFDGSKNKYDFVVTDYTMPQITGVQLSRIIKQRYPDKKLILMSGFLDEKLETFKLENIIDEYLVKPLTPQELCNKIEEMSQLYKGDD